MELIEARPEHIPAITDIYNHAIRTSTATFDTVEKSVEDRMQWLTSHGDEYPVIVALIDERVAGWGSLTRYAERPGWRFTVENAVYVHPEFQGRGVGKAVLLALIERAKRLGFRTIVAQIVEGNDTSLHLHKQCRFEIAGTLKDAGFKFDHWLDVILMQKPLP